MMSQVGRNYEVILSPDDADEQRITVMLVSDDLVDATVSIPDWSLKAFRFQREVILDGRSYYVKSNPSKADPQSHCKCWYVNLSYYWPPVSGEAFNG